MFFESAPRLHDEFSQGLGEGTDTRRHQKGQSGVIASEEHQGKQQGWFVTKVLL